MSNEKEPTNNKRYEKYEKEIEELKNQLKNEIEKNNKIQNDFEQYKSKEKEIIDENKKFKTDLENTRNEYGELEKTINQIKVDIKNGEIIDKYRQFQNENLKLKNQIEILKTNDESENKRLNQKLNEDLFEERNKNIKLEEDMKKIKNEKIEEFANYIKNDYNEEYIEKKLEYFYDIVINIRSISSLSTPEGWPIKWNLNRKEDLKQIEGKELFKIGVLGNGNMGKSFLLSRLFDEKIPSGFSIVTEGLSIKHNYEKGYTILDSAGLQTPLIKEDEKIEEEKINNKKSKLRESYIEKDFKAYENLYKDKTQTENFIQNLILYLSDMLLIVVGKITFNEQRLINKIKKEIELGNRDENKKKQIFIIHNLLNFQTRKQVDEHIKGTLLKSASFKLDKKKDIIKSQEMKDEIFYFVENESEFQTYHLIMAREGTEAGKYYNKYTYDFLKEKFNNFTLRKPLSIIEEVKNRFVDWSTDLLEEKIEPENIEILKDEKNGLEKCYIYKSKEGENKAIIPKACISDELGFSIYRSNGYEPPYNYFTDENYLIIKLEIPGKVEIEDCYGNIDTNEIIVIGNKDEEGENIKHKNTRKFGKFNLHIHYGSQIKLANEIPIEDKDEEENEGEKYDNKKNKIKGKNGIFTFKFKI